MPASKARDVGFDRSLIGAYGHDDRSCAFTSLIGLLEQTSTPKNRDGLPCGQRRDRKHRLYGYAERLLCLRDEQSLKDERKFRQPLDVQEMLWNSICISADVKPAFEPIFSSVYDESNSARLNGGPSITKYTGARGKSGASDADAELVAGLRALLSSANIPYQWGASGKVDEGGGGTVAKFVAHRGVRTIDLGLPMLSMHAPYELASKFDVYSYYQAMKAFFSQGIQIG